MHRRMIRFSMLLSGRCRGVVGRQSRSIDLAMFRHLMMSMLERVRPRRLLRGTIATERRSGVVERRRRSIDLATSRRSTMSCIDLHLPLLLAIVPRHQQHRTSTVACRLAMLRITVIVQHHHAPPHETAIERHRRHIPEAAQMGQGRHLRFSCHNLTCRLRYHPLALVPRH
jgi:hypothetical protein